MGQLIIILIAIALGIIVAIAGVSYLGNAFSEGAAKSTASAMVNQSQQIAGAAVMYSNDNAGAFAPDIATLVANGYLASTPVPDTRVATGAYSLNQTSVTLAVDGPAGPAACEKLNLSVGIPDADPTTTAYDFPTYDSATQQPGDAFTQAYGCAAEATSGALAFQYK